jgi:BCCT, betaine/carnitine/choline family transporter
MTPTARPGRDGRTPAGAASAAEPAAADDEPRTDQHPAIAAPPPPVADEKGSLDRVVFTVSATLALAFVAWGFLSPAGLGSASSTALTWIETHLGWLFVTLASAFVVYVLWLAASKYGRIPLGRDDEAPEFRTVSWIAMMFSAGMGIGLMFYGVAEPLAHYVSPPPRTVEGQTPRPSRRRWPPRCSTGRCTRGPSTPWWVSRSPTAPSAAGASS